MRVAVQISGQLRNWKKGFPSFQKYFKDYDVFACIVSDNNYGSEHGSRTSSTDLKEAIEYFSPIEYYTIPRVDKKYFSYYQSSAKMVNNYDDIDLSNDDEVNYDKILYSNSILGIEKDSFPKFYAPFPPVQWCSQFYNVWKCNEIRKKYEEQKGIKYDVIIRTRFDLVYKGILNIAQLDLDHFLYVPNSSCYGNFIHVDDKLFIASPYKADIVCEFFNKMASLISEVNQTIGIPVAGSIEFLYAYWLLKNKMAIKGLNAMDFSMDLSRF